MQEKKNTAELQEKTKSLKKNISTAEEHVKECEEKRDKAIMPIGNLVPDSVPVSNDEVRACVAADHETSQAVSFAVSNRLLRCRMVTSC